MALTTARMARSRHCDRDFYPPKKIRGVIPSKIRQDRVDPAELIGIYRADRCFAPGIEIRSQAALPGRTGGRVVEGARLERVYT